MRGLQTTSLPSWAYSHQGYALYTTLQQMLASGKATLLTLIVLGTSMTLPTLILFASDDAAKLPDNSVRGQSITLYLDTSINDLDGAALARDIAKRDNISDVNFISRTEALAQFQQHSEFADAADVLDTNPLPASIVVYPTMATQNRESAQLLARQLQARPGVEAVQVDLQWVERLSAMVALAKVIALILAILLTVTSLVVIANTLRLEILRRKKETEVTQLLGATRRFVRRPYLYLGVLYGLLGGLLAICLATLLQLLVSSSIQRLASAYGSHFQLSMPSLSQTGIILAISTLLGVAGTLITLLRPLDATDSTL